MVVKSAVWVWAKIKSRLTGKLSFFWLEGKTNFRKIRGFD